MSSIDTPARSSSPVVCESADTLRAFLNNIPEIEGRQIYEPSLERSREFCRSVIGDNEQGYAAETLPEVVVSEIDEQIHHLKWIRAKLVGEYGVVWPPKQ